MPEWLTKFIIRIAMGGNTFAQAIAWLQGYKTYVVCAGALLTAAGSYLDGAIDKQTLIEAIFAALAAASVRHGITTSMQKSLVQESKPPTENPNQPLL
jgi:hypothetical protein